MNLNILSVFPFPALVTSRIFFSVGDSFSPAFAIISVYLEIPTNVHPIGSMYGTSTIQINHSCRWIYQSHGWYRHENIHPSLYLIPIGWQVYEGREAELDEVGFREVDPSHLVAPGLTLIIMIGWWKDVNRCFFFPHFSCFFLSIVAYYLLSIGYSRVPFFLKPWWITKVSPPKKTMDF